MALTPFARDPYHNFFEKNKMAFLKVDEKKFDDLESVLSSKQCPKAILDRDEMSIRYEKFATPIKTTEIPPTLKKDYAITYLKMALRLEKEGLTLTNSEFLSCHVDFNSEPFFKDFSSIVKKSNNTRFPFIDFINNQYALISLYNKYPRLIGLARDGGKLDIEDLMAIEHKFANFFLSALSNLLSKPLSKKISRFVKVYPFLYKNKLNPLALVEIFKFLFDKNRSAEGVINLLLKELQSLPNFCFEGKWTDYYSSIDLEATFSEKSNWKINYQGNRAKAIIKVLEEDADKKYTLLDTGSNQGYFSLIGSNLGYRVTAMDYDVASIDHLYRRLKKEAYRYELLPLVVNFSNLTSNDLQRLRSDYVIALGFTHHLWYVEGYTWEQISNTFSSLSEKVFITEFKPNTKGRGSKTIKSLAGSRYELDDFTEALKKNFKTVEVVGEYTAEASTAGRLLIVARK
tara:strand:+ start:14661 stop:16034 length:1374 start_codon:yes stop_codon:yes gene_type:complete